jgi:hypothetical protein
MAHRRARATSTSLEQLLAANEVVVTCGSEVWGKTTSAAALGAMAAAHLGGRVLVLTVDPARGWPTPSASGVRQRRVRRSPVGLHRGGHPAQGRLFAAMLDTKQSWDDLVRQHAPSPEVRDAILANPLYENITGKFVQSHDYIAMERLYEIHSSGTYDLIVVDTPPTRNAIDFLEAPERMADFFSSRLLRWLTWARRGASYASKPSTIADRILGSQFLQDIGSSSSCSRPYDGFVSGPGVSHCWRTGTARGGLDPGADPGPGGRVLVEALARESSRWAPWFQQGPAHRPVRPRRPR